MSAFVSHPSVRLKGSEDHYDPEWCTGCQFVQESHMHCPFCPKSESSFQEEKFLKAHYGVKHVDKGIEYAGLKILRCCDNCEIIGTIKCKKNFRSSHWHCFRCRNGFCRKDEALKHYKTHFRNPKTTFQINITQDINEAMREQAAAKASQGAESVFSVPSDVHNELVMGTVPEVVTVPGQALGANFQEGQIEVHNFNGIVTMSDDPSAFNSYAILDIYKGHYVEQGISSGSDEQKSSQVQFKRKERRSVDSKSGEEDSQRPSREMHWLAHKRYLEIRCSDLEGKLTVLKKENTQLQEEVNRLQEQKCPERLQAQILNLTAAKEEVEARNRELDRRLLQSPNEFIKYFRCRQGDFLNTMLQEYKNSGGDPSAFLPAEKVQNAMNVTPTASSTVSVQLPAPSTMFVPPTPSSTVSAQRKASTVKVEDRRVMNDVTIPSVVESAAVGSFLVQTQERSVDSMNMSPDKQSPKSRATPQSITVKKSVKASEQKDVPAASSAKGSTGDAVPMETIVANSLSNASAPSASSHTVPVLLGAADVSSSGLACNTALPGAPRIPVGGQAGLKPSESDSTNSVVSDNGNNFSSRHPSATPSSHRIGLPKVAKRPDSSSPTALEVRPSKTQSVPAELSVLVPPQATESTAVESTQPSVTTALEGAQIPLMVSEAVFHQSPAATVVMSEMPVFQDVPTAEAYLPAPGNGGYIDSSMYTVVDGVPHVLMCIDEEGSEEEEDEEVSDEEEELGEHQVVYLDDEGNVLTPWPQNALQVMPGGLHSTPDGVTYQIVQTYDTDDEGEEDSVSSTSQQQHSTKRKSQTSMETSQEKKTKR